MVNSHPKLFWLFTFALAIAAAAGGFFVAQYSVDLALATQTSTTAPGGCGPGDPGCPFTELQRAGTGFEGSTGEFARIPKPLPVTIFRFVRYFLGFIATYFLLMMLYAGYLYFSAGGSSEQVENARKTIRNAVIGMIVVSMTFAVLTLIFRAIYPPDYGLDIPGLFGDEEQPEITEEEFEEAAELLGP